jgi:hypothetical protein
VRETLELESEPCVVADSFRGPSRRCLLRSGEKVPRDTHHAA